MKSLVISLVYQNSLTLYSSFSLLFSFIIITLSSFLFFLFTFIYYLKRKILFHFFFIILVLNSISINLQFILEENSVRWVFLLIKYFFFFSLLGQWEVGDLVFL